MNIYFISLGCDKNRVDSEVMLSILNEGGHTIVYNENDAEVIIINTCSFIHDAQEESINTILEMAQLKDTAKCKYLIACGCLAERYKDEMLTEIPELDAVIGTTAYEDIIKAISDCKKGIRSKYIKDINHLPEYHGRIITTGYCSAYLKIAEGCSKHCTYCIIPQLKGNFRSIPMEDILKDAEYLASIGIKEVNIIAQETTVYGQDIYGRKMLPELLEKLCLIDGFKWIRIMYCYPEEITDELINVIAKEPKICNYIDMPIQHASDKILKRMGRQTNRRELINIIGKLRAKMPDICIRTTLITGFPGETEEDHEILKTFVSEMKFDRLGTFTFSPEEGTPAFIMDGQVDENVKTARQEELMLIQQEIAFEKAEVCVGSVFNVIISGYIKDEDIYIGRSYKDAPDVDGYVFVNAKSQLMSGDIIKVKITEANEYDLVGDELIEFT